MGLTADIYDIFGFTNHVISEAAALQASITDVTTAVNHFAALLDNQSGATVVSMRNYITGFASSIQAIADAVNMAFTQILMVYQGAYALLDSDAYAVIDEDTISEVLNAYRNSYLWMDDELDIVKEMYYRVCGFTDVTMPSFENAFTRIEEFEAREREYRQALLDTEESFDANELVLLQNLTESSLTYLTGLMPQGYNAVTAPPNVKINGVTDISASLAEREQQIQDVWAHGFVAGANNTACLQITNNPELYNSILGIYGYMMQNEETINGLSEISRDTCETYITDAKWEEGWKKIATGAFALMSGAGALGVAIGEAGTLLTVLGFASGGSSLLFGTSELFEGTQDVSISVQGLKYTDAINPLKDLMGEEAYNKALAISTTTADVVCLAGAVKNTVKGIRDAKAAKGMPEEVPTEVPKIEEPNLAEIEKQADLEGEFYEDIFESQRADIPEYEDYLSDFAEAQNDYVKPAGGKSGTTTKPNQVHHFASNKSKKYTSQFESITKKYGLDLDGDWNKQSMPHQGRHPYAYHDYVLDNMQKFDRIANGDKTKFLKLYDQMKQKIINNPEMLYKDYWKK
ncbi:MAG: AHH domain-containing protein [Lachnospiraceae bacterium]|jgi:hypothetical protein